jgi:hypothetical protein
MDKRKLLLGALVASAIGVIPVTASAAVGVYVDVAPPAPRYEVVPAPRAGFIWAPGYWDWSGGHYHWKRGHWMREHRGQYWHPDRWEQRDGHWVHERGSWNRERWNGERVAERDRDHDGVPNRLDRAPDNPYRR